VPDPWFLHPDELREIEALLLSPSRVIDAGSTQAHIEACHRLLLRLRDDRRMMDEEIRRARAAESNVLQRAIELENELHAAYEKLAEAQGQPARPAAANPLHHHTPAVPPPPGLSDAIEGPPAPAPAIERLTGDLVAIERDRVTELEHGIVNAVLAIGASYRGARS
jgi:hypothetical protein